jgi:hypothetical protein
MASVMLDVCGSAENLFLDVGKYGDSAHFMGILRVI